MRITNSINSYYRTGLLLLLCLFLCRSVNAQTRAFGGQRTRVLFILDASGSMKDTWNGVPRFTTAKQVIRQMMDSLGKEKNIEVALRVFGHQSPKDSQDCKDTRLEVPFSYKSIGRISQKLDSLEPKGYTPIALSLNSAVNDFQRNTTIRNLIVLVTDGIENCTGNICDAAADLQAKGIAFKPYIVGLGLTEEQKKLFDCAGMVFNIDQEQKAKFITSVVITTVLNPTSMQVNLINEYGKSSETNLNMSFYDFLNKDLKYNLYHTLNASGSPDTITIPPSNGYKLVVHSLPELKKDTVKLVQGKHTIAALDLSQGSISFKTEGVNKYKSLKCIVRQAGSQQVLNAQEPNTIRNYRTGKYDIDVLTTPLTFYRNVEVKQGQDFAIKVPIPGTVNFTMAKPGITTLFAQENGVIRKVYSFPNDAKGGTLQLLPGDYIAQYRNKLSYKSTETVEKNFKVIGGGITNIKF